MRVVYDNAVYRPELPLLRNDYPSMWNTSELAGEPDGTAKTK